MGVKLKQCTDFEKHYERFTDILGGNRDLNPCPWCLKKRIEELEGSEAQLSAEHCPYATNDEYGHMRCQRIEELEGEIGLYERHRKALQLLVRRCDKEIDTRRCSEGMLRAMNHARSILMLGDKTLEDG